MGKSKILKDLSDLVGLIERVAPEGKAKKAALDDPMPFLEFMSSSMGKRVQISDFDYLEPWGIAVLATLGRTSEAAKIYIANECTTPSARFAHSLGLNQLIAGNKALGVEQEGRTVKLTRVTKFDEIEPISDKISRLIIGDDELPNEGDYFDPREVRATIRYVMVELLRNVIQHSMDRWGAIILAQRQHYNDDKGEATIQIAVVDRGVGIQESLHAAHPEINDAEMALERSIWPGISGTFSSYQSGSSQNAGMGLFFVSEMAKLTGGRVLISSRGATLYIQGDPEAFGNNKSTLCPLGFEGTLVAFEMPNRGVADYESLNRRIIELARERSPREEVHRWISFKDAPGGSMEFMISVASENTIEAEIFSTEELLPRIERGQVLVLNFARIPICTQSYMHALLFNVVRKAYELKVPLYARSVSSSVADGIYLLESYAL